MTKLAIVDNNNKSIIKIESSSIMLQQGNSKRKFYKIINPSNMTCK